ncbi:MAG: carboxymuconolactone decarboxylase family protein [Pseudomonadota bacterium]
MDLTPEQQAFKDAYIRSRGYWVPFNDGLLRHSPEWLTAYLAYAGAPARDGPLTPRMRELIYVAVDTSTTHMFTQGLEIHVRAALAVGCTADELIEVMQIATMQGLDSVSAGMAILAEEAADLGIALPDRGDPTPLLDQYEGVFGDRPDWLAAVARATPAYAQALVDLLVVADRHGGLSLCETALIRLALAASPTHLNRDAMRVETRRALRAGATPDEVVQVFQLVAHLGIHACVDGVPAIVAAAA